MAQEGTLQLASGRKTSVTMPGAFPGAEAGVDAILFTPPPSPHPCPTPKKLSSSPLKIERKPVPSSDKPKKKKKTTTYWDSIGYKRIEGEKKWIHAQGEVFWDWESLVPYFREHNMKGLRRGVYPSYSIFNQNRSGRQLEIQFFVSEDLHWLFGVRRGVRCWKSFFTWTGVVCDKSGLLKDWVRKHKNKRLQLNNHPVKELSQRKREEPYEPEAAHIFFTWAHEGSVEKSMFYRPIDYASGCMERAHAKHWKEMVDAYRLGKFFRAPEFSNVIIDLLVKNQKSFFEHCPLSQVVNKSEWWPTYEYGMVKSILKEARYASQSEKPWKKDPCTYHEHANAPKSYSCTKQWYGRSESSEIVSLY